MTLNDKQEQKIFFEMRLVALEKAQAIHNIGFQGSTATVEEIIETARKLEAYFKDSSNPKG